MALDYEYPTPLYWVCIGILTFWSNSWRVSMRSISNFWAEVGSYLNNTLLFSGSHFDKFGIVF